MDATGAVIPWIFRCWTSGRTKLNPGDSGPLHGIHRKQIMARLGIGYRFSGRTVLRTGAGQFYNGKPVE